MSCPYFYPQERETEVSDLLPARIPLGLLYKGECRANPAGLSVPQADTAGEHCNFGYGHGSCANFPHDAGADAVRFTLSSSRELIWILEKDFAPVRYGRIDEADTMVRRQAEVFLENYERYIERTAGSRIDF
jgi:hypothetical protein